MAISVSTHLNFKGQARDALALYHSAFGGSLVTVTYEDAHAADTASSPQDVMWGQVQATSGFRIMAYDVQANRPWHPGENAVYVVVEGTDPDEIAGYWHALSEGATTLQALAPSAWSPLYGMLQDRFGIVWVLSVAQDNAS
jgi:PhnB protein